MRFYHYNHLPISQERINNNNLICSALLILLIFASTHLSGQEIELFKGATDISKQPSQEAKKIKLPETGKPFMVKPFKDYQTIVDCDIIIDAGADMGRIEANKLLWSLKICRGKPETYKESKTKEEKITRYNPFVVIASMPAAYFVFTQWTEIANRPFKTIEIEKQVNDPLESNELEAYQSPKGTFAVFMPKGYDKKWLNPYLKPLTTSNIRSYNKIKKMTPLKSLRYGPYSLSEEAKKVDLEDLESIFSKDITDIALCVRLSGHGSYKKTIAEMTRDTYLKFLELLNKLNTQFLFVSSCFAGGKNALIMHGAEEKSLMSITELKSQKKEFGFQDIQFPIVVEATTDEISTAEFYSAVYGTDNEYALNTFFGLLHAYLQSPTWDVGMTRKEWHEKHGEGPLVLMKDVLKPLFLVQPLIENLPSIFIPDLLVRGGVFFQAVKVDDMAIITNKTLNKLLKSGKRKIEIGDKTKYVLMYPVDMSEMTIEVLPEILSSTPPAFISKIGGDSYHILGTLLATTCHTNDLIEKSFLYRLSDEFGRAMGVSNKAWFVKEMRMIDDVWRYVAIYKPDKAITTTSGKSTQCSIVVYQSDKDKKWYAVQVNIGKDKNGLKQSFEEPMQVSEAYYACLLGTIKDQCTPDPMAVLRFTDGKENISTAQKAFEDFLSLAVKFPIKGNPKDEIERIQNKYLTLKEPNLIIMAAKKLLQALETSGKLETDLLNKINKINEVLKKEH